MSPETIFETGYGKVAGSIIDGVQLFRGIPYGGPTEGTGRWLPPTRPAPWTGVFDATRNGPRAIQPPGSIFTTPVLGPYFSGGRADAGEWSHQDDSENCLVLNVLTPAAAGKRPVMVYIHGGGFFTGSGALTLFADKFVREQDVVLVGINHRLNVFGYLYLGGLSERYAQGNPGQLDLIAALEWVRDNITHFGGDPANVTIFGESGGGGKISALLGMPAAKRLFKRAIVQSGSLTHAGSAAEGTEAAKTIMDNLGLAEGDVDSLAALPAQRIFGALAARAGGPPLGMRLGPVVDGVTLPEQPWEPAATAHAAGIPLLIGCCKDEATLFARDNPAVYSLDWKGLHAELEKTGLSAADTGSLMELYRRLHPAESASDLYFRIRTDRTMRSRVYAQAELKLAQGDPLYMYYFSWNTPDGDGQLRAFHTADLPLEMRVVLHPQAEELSKQLASAWAGFARDGNPGSALLPAWPQYDLEKRATMVFDIPACTVVDDPDGEAREFLKDRPSDGVL